MRCLKKAIKISFIGGVEWSNTDRFWINRLKDMQNMLQNGTIYELTAEFVSNVFKFDIKNSRNKNRPYICRKLLTKTMLRTGAAA